MVERESRWWRELIERYHYLGCHVPFGANLRYWVRNRDRELACLRWTSPARKIQARDAWIGWSDEQRKRNLQWIIHNGRFLVLPWVRVTRYADAWIGNMKDTVKSSKAFTYIRHLYISIGPRRQASPSWRFPGSANFPHFGDCLAISGIVFASQAIMQRPQRGDVFSPQTGMRKTVFQSLR